MHSRTSSRRARRCSSPRSQSSWHVWWSSPAFMSCCRNLASSSPRPAPGAALASAPRQRILTRVAVSGCLGTALKFRQITGARVRFRLRRRHGETYHDHDQAPPPPGRHDAAATIDVQIRHPWSSLHHRAKAQKCGAPPPMGSSDRSWFACSALLPASPTPAHLLAIESHSPIDF